MPQLFFKDGAAHFTEAKVVPLNGVANLPLRRRGGNKASKKRHSLLRDDSPFSTHCSIWFGLGSKITLISSGYGEVIIDTIYLSLQDLSNMAMTCKYFKTVAYSDYVWLPRFRLDSSSTSLQTSGVREAYVARRRALRQFNFIDPFGIDIIVEAKPFDHLLMDKTNIYFSQNHPLCIQLPLWRSALLSWLLRAHAMPSHRALVYLLGHRYRGSCTEYARAL